MTWPHICPRCGATSLRHCIGDRKPVCAHEYHAAEDCGVCGDCRNPAAATYIAHHALEAER